ncbi:Alkaline shock protein 23 [Streptomyces lydicus]|nr:Alkaline shock protein 23 [Streptomyces lydicus]
MTESGQQNRPTASGAESTGEGTRKNAGVKRGDPNMRGRTTIADGVVEKIAGMAARDVAGVHALGSGISRAFGAARERVPGTTKSVSRGVKVEVGETQAAIDLEIVVVYGVSITDVAGAVRQSVISAVEWMTGLEVVEVNIAVSDVKLPEEEEEEEEQPRLR